MAVFRIKLHQSKKAKRAAERQRDRIIQHNLIHAGEYQRYEQARPELRKAEPRTPASAIPGKRAKPVVRTKLPMRATEPV